jgi:hypothetical protein
MHSWGENWPAPHHHGPQRCLSVTIKVLLPQTSQVPRRTQLSTFETLRPCASIHGVEISTQTWCSRCTDMAILSHYKRLAHVQEEAQQLPNLPEASPIRQPTRLPTSETLRPCAGSHGVENCTITCRQRGLERQGRSGDFSARNTCKRRHNTLLTSPGLANLSTYSIVNF